MAYVYYVTTREELKRAIESKAKYISIKSAEVAKHVSVMKTASKAALTAALVAAGLSTAMIWNPIGWAGAIGTAVFAGSVTVAVTFLAFTLGVSTFWNLYGDYEVIARGVSVTLSDNTVVEGELILSRK